MTLKPDHVTVGASATRIDAADTVLGMSIMFRNRGSVAVFVGSSDVSTATGYRLDPGERMSLELRPGDGGVWGITANGTTEVHRIQVGG